MIDTKPDFDEGAGERPAGFLDQASPVPLYHQLRQALEQSWRAGFTAEDELPTERDIMNQFQVSRITVRRALDDMMADGVIHRPRRRGRLHFAPVKVRQRLNRLRGFFSDDALSAGHHPSTRVLEVAQGVWPETNRLLGLPGDAACFRIARLHESDGRPLSYQVSFIASGDCPDLMLSDLSRSLLQMMEARYGRRAQHAEQRLAAREATAEETAILQLPRRSYVFEVDRVSYDEHGEAIEYFMSVLDVARYEFHTSLTADPGNGAAGETRSPWLTETSTAPAASHAASTGANE
jgi:GntR family transcriptional regulator